MKILVLDKGCTRISVPDEWEIGGFAALDGIALLRFILPSGEEAVFEVFPSQGVREMSRRIRRPHFNAPSSGAFRDGKWPMDPREAGVQSALVNRVFGTTTQRPIDLSKLPERFDGVL